ncbi:MAG: hypothetical protein HYW34_02540 [Candidatus Brennerbacteria bacterium]|nr:hypothetical protein [Candidatus Brennerbacteria bacterium]
MFDNKNSNNYKAIAASNGIKFTETAVIFLAFVIALTHILAMYFGWYFDTRFDWIDIPLHFMGGIFAAMFSWWFGHRFTRFNIFHDDFFKNILILISVAATIGVLWEFFEFSFDYFVVSQARFNWLNLAQPSKADTMADLFFDILGGLTAGIILKIGSKRAK